MTSNGNQIAAAHPAAGAVEPSRLLDYLPAIYQNDPFIGRFLRIFEDLHQPLRGAVSALPLYFDPRLTTGPMRDQLARWVGVSVPPQVSERAAGELIARELELHRWRGTKRGLGLALEIATGHRPRVIDATDGLTLGDAAAMGAGATLEDARAFEIRVRFDCAPSDVRLDVVEAIIDRHKPVHVTHHVEFTGA